MSRKGKLGIVFFSIVLLSLIFLFFSPTAISKFTTSNFEGNEANSQIHKALNISDKSLSYEAERNIKIAIVDSGINRSHSDLNIPPKNAINFIQNDLPVNDEFNHGTAVAGIIAAQDNDVGIVGVANKAEIFDLKVLNDKGKGEIKNLIKAIEWCIENQMDIVNISFGFQTSNDELFNIIQKAHDNKIVIVAAAGNTYGTGVDYPAKYENVISVNSINENNEPLNSSAHGKIDFATLGLNVLSTNHKGDYAQFTGTSFSAAYVTGIIANLMSQNLISKENIVADLQEYSQDIYETDFDSYTGNGLLKLEKN